MKSKFWNVAFFVALIFFAEFVFGTSLWAVVSKAKELKEIWLNVVAVWLFIIMVAVFVFGIVNAVLEWYKKTPE